jgi:hypothetical protein
MNPEIDEKGNKRWFNIVNKLQLHRKDGPAIEYDNGDKYWYLYGERHREDGPAIELITGYKSWYQNGKRHRDDGPAIINNNGDKEWFIEGKRHREDGPAVEYADGKKSWYYYDKPFNSEIDYYREIINQTSDPDKIKALKSKLIKLTLK